MENYDIYGDLEQFNVKEKIDQIEEEKNELSKTVENLENTLEKFTLEITELRNVKNNLEKNISELFKTAKAEIQRKDKQIEDLRNELDSVSSKNHKGNDGKSRKKIDNLIKENEFLKHNVNKEELNSRLSKLKENIKDKEDIIANLNKKLNNLTAENKSLKRNLTSYENHTLKRKASRSDDERDVKLRKLNNDFPRDKPRKLNRVSRRSLSKSPDSSRYKRERNYSRRDSAPNNRSRYSNDRYHRYDKRDYYHSNRHSTNLSDDDDKFHRTNIRDDESYRKKSSCSTTKTSGGSRTYDSEDKDDSDYVRRKSPVSGVSPEPISDNDTIEFDESSNRAESESRGFTPEVIERNLECEDKTDYQRRLRRISEDRDNIKSTYVDRKDLIESNTKNKTSTETNLKREDGRSCYVETNERKKGNDVENKDFDLKDVSPKYSDNFDSCKINCNLNRKERYDKESRLKIKNDNNKSTTNYDDNLSDNHNKKEKECTDDDFKRNLKYSAKYEKQSDKRKLIENESVSVEDIESLERKKLELEKQLQEEGDSINHSISCLENVDTNKTSENLLKSVSKCSDNSAVRSHLESSNYDLEDCLEIGTSPLPEENDSLILGVQIPLKHLNNRQELNDLIDVDAVVKKSKVAGKVKRQISQKSNEHYEATIPVTNSQHLRDQKEFTLLKSFTPRKNQEKLRNTVSKRHLDMKSEVFERKNDTPFSKQIEAELKHKKVVEIHASVNEDNLEDDKTSTSEQLEKRLNTAESSDLENQIATTFLQQSNEEIKKQRHQIINGAVEKEHNVFSKESKESLLQFQEVELHILEKEENITLLKQSENITCIIANDVETEQSSKKDESLYTAQVQILENEKNVQQRPEESKLQHSTEVQILEKQMDAIFQEKVEDFKSQEQHEIKFVNNTLQEEHAGTIPTENKELTSQPHHISHNNYKEDIFPEHSERSKYINDSLSIKELSSIFETDYLVYTKANTPSEHKLETNLLNVPTSIISTQNEVVNDSLNENDFEKSNNSTKTTDESVMNSSSETKQQQKKQFSRRRRCVITIT